MGEAGVFTDPFYSPGSDFIAIGNDYVTDLIIRDLPGEDIAARAEAFNTTYLRLFDAFIRLYDGQYPLMGNAQVMTAKVAWDNACYWAITALLFFQRRFRQLEFIASIDRSAAPVLRPARADAADVPRLGSRRLAGIRQRLHQPHARRRAASAAGGARRPLARRRSRCASG